MQQQDNVTIRLVFKCGGLADEPVECKAADNVWETKCRLLRAWPIRFPRARSPTDLRIIFLGKEVRDEETVAELRARANSEPVVVHLIVRERNPGSPGTPKTPTIHYAGSPSVNVRRGPLLGADAAAPTTPGSPAPVPGMPVSSPDTAPTTPATGEQEADVHFHAVTVSERELGEFRAIFDKKKGADGLIALATVRMVLQSYWRFIHREGFEATPRPFPEERLEQLRRKVDAAGGLTLDQFLTVFYLFDNAASEEPCVHGDKERVRLATAQLHSVMQPQHDFYHDRFEQIFSLVCGDENQQTLTCKERSCTTTCTRPLCWSACARRNSSRVSRRLSA